MRLIERGPSTTGWVPFVVLGLLGCGREAPPPAAPPSVEPSPPVVVSPRPNAEPPAPRPPAPIAIVWRDGPLALERARADGRPVMAFFHADWSASSVAFARRLESSEAVRRAAAKGIAVRVDLTETTEDNEELAARYSVDHVPTILVLDSKGRTSRFEGEIDTDELVDELTRAFR